MWKASLQTSPSHQTVRRVLPRPEGTVGSQACPCWEEWEALDGAGGAEASLGEPSGRRVRGSSARKWPGEEWALRDSKACQLVGKRRREVRSQVPQRGEETATGTRLQQHQTCRNPASPCTAGLEPAGREGRDLEGMVRESVYSPFISVSSPSDSPWAGGDGALQREARPWHPPPPFGFDRKQDTSQSLKGYRKSPVSSNQCYIHHQ